MINKVRSIEWFGLSVGDSFVYWLSFTVVVFGYGFSARFFERRVMMSVQENLDMGYSVGINPDIIGQAREKVKHEG